MKHLVRGILMPLFCTAIALISVGTLGDIGVSAASSTPAPKLVQPIKADPRTGAPIRNNSSSGTNGKTTSSSTQKGQKATNQGKTTTTKAVTKDLSSTYTWQHQEQSNGCWTASGSMVISSSFGKTIPQDYFYEVNSDKKPNSQGNIGNIKKVFDQLQRDNNTNMTFCYFKPSDDSYKNVINGIDNGHIVYMSTEYDKTGHGVVCDSYRTDGKGNYQLSISDPLPKKEENGKYWTNTINTRNSTYTVSNDSKINSNNVEYAQNYGTVQIKGVFYIK